MCNCVFHEFFCDATVLSGVAFDATECYKERAVHFTVVLTDNGAFLMLQNDAENSSI